MTEQSTQDRYFTLLKQYVAQPGEERLAEAAELGRTLVKADVPPEEIGELHEAAVCRLAEELPDMRLLDAATLISTPLMELFMAYGLAFRERIEARRRAEEELRRAHNELELRVRRRTAELADANARLQEEITERVRSEQRERQLQAEVAHVDRLTTMGEMASGLAHELNQPLAAIVIQAETLPHYLPPDSKENHKKLLQSLKFLAEQAHRAGDLIRRMRQFAQKIGPRRSTVTFREIVDEVVPLVKMYLREAGIALAVEIEQSLPHIFGDKIQLQQVLLNLVRNAIEAMQDTEIDERRLSIKVRQRGGMIEVAVRDTGCGITADKIGRIDELFTTFYTTKPEGMGMGLGIARSIVESHGGQISAAPNPDRGATFTFTLPIPPEVQEDETEAVRVCGR